MDTKQVAMKMQVIIMPLKDVVVFPGSIMPLFVGREKSINAVQEASKRDRQVFLVAQKDPDLDNPTKKDLYKIGTLARVLQTLKLPDGTVKVLVEGVQRFSLEHLYEDGDFLEADIAALEDEDGSAEETQSLLSILKERFSLLATLRKKFPSEVRETIKKTQDARKIVDLVASNMALVIERKQDLLEPSSLQLRIEKLLAYVEEDIDLIESERRIKARVKKQMDKTQRDYYLNEKVKAIHKELSQTGEDEEDEFSSLDKKIAKARLPKAALKKAKSELAKLKQMQPMSAEANVVRNYLDWMLSLPWRKSSRLSNDLKKAEKLLDNQHYGLEKVKERIIEYLAVQKRVGKLKGPILCLVGPPGVGKTSLARSIAEATNRKYVRMALGGVRDEAEIRGHRKTYIGALPGKILQKMESAGTRNPLFLLDEVDKMASDSRGDPAAALLEVLDPEQNSEFNDHYLEVDYDLSNVMFIATSNSMAIPEPLLDRMEVINLSGYTEQEKTNIAIKHLLPKQLKDHGLKDSELVVQDAVIQSIIQSYTREAGVRDLDRNLAKICRKAVKQLVVDSETTPSCIEVTLDNLEDYLGVKKHRFGIADNKNRIGQVTGLAWTRVGGDLLRIEATAMPGKGKLESTGQLGSVMSESVKAAMSVIRSRSNELGLVANFYEKVDLHLHFPEGAIKKDGPSAGIAVCTAITSVLTQIPVRADVAMTGEVTLRGEVLPIGGVKEKLLAALRGGIKTVLIPTDNMRDLAEISDDILSQLEIKPVQWIEEVFEVALTEKPNPFDEKVALIDILHASNQVSAH